MPKNAVEFVTGLDLTKILCPHCGKPALEETAETIKCTNCGMGKNKSGKR